MMARAGSGWQYILADLSLILFMVTAAALAQAQDAPAKPDQRSTAAPKTGLAPTEAVQRGEPMGVYRPLPGAPSLKTWLASQASDQRQQLTIVAQYRPGGQIEALEQARSLLDDAQEAGAQARVVIEPGLGEVQAVLAFDTSPNSEKGTQP